MLSASEQSLSSCEVIGWGQILNVINDTTHLPCICDHTIGGLTKRGHHHNVPKKNLQARFIVPHSPLASHPFSGIIEIGPVTNGPKFRDFWHLRVLSNSLDFPGFRDVRYLLDPQILGFRDWTSGGVGRGPVNILSEWSGGSLGGNIVSSTESL